MDEKKARMLSEIMQYYEDYDGTLEESLFRWVMEEAKKPENEYVYMVKIEKNSGEKVIDLNDHGYHGAFKSYRSASEWLIKEGYEAFFDDELSELLEEESIRFIIVNEPSGESYIATVEEYFVQE